MDIEGAVKPQPPLDTRMKMAWDDNFLYSLLIELTYRCNLDCFFCYNDLSLKGRALSLEQYFAMFEDLKNKKKEDKF